MAAAENEADGADGSAGRDAPGRTAIYISGGAERRREREQTHRAGGTAAAGWRAHCISSRCLQTACRAGQMGPPGVRCASQTRLRYTGKNVTYVYTVSESRKMQHQTQIKSRLLSR
jgi:hypothetical protein